MGLFLILLGWVRVQRLVVLGCYELSVLNERHSTAKSDTEEEKSLYALCDQMFSILSLFASVICPGLPFRTQARSFLSKLLVSVQMPVMVLWA